MICGQLCSVGVGGLEVEEGSIEHESAESMYQ